MLSALEIHTVFGVINNNIMNASIISLPELTSKNVLINCSNLHGGGGVAVAASFIDALSKLQYSNINIYLLISSDVKRNLSGLGTDINVFEGCDVKDYYGLDAIWRGLSWHFRNADIIFTVFGPAYFVFSNKYHIFGFAQPNIIYPSNPISNNLKFFDRIKLKFKYKIQEYFYSKADSIIVELEHVKKRLEALGSFSTLPIHIVYSSVHSVYKQPNHWTALNLPNQVSWSLTRGDTSLKFGVISKNYPHKNLKILTLVKKSLRLNYNINADFYVTFTQYEWSNCSEEFKAEIINVGEIVLSQCPTFYSLMDGVVFPTLLECFSAVPIETMMVKKPLFGSDLSFIRDVCGGCCNYFDPLDANDIARAIFEYFSQSAVEQHLWVNSAYEHVKKFPGSEERAKNYMAIINHVLSNSLEN